MHALTFSLPYSFAASQGFYFCLIWINKDVCEENGATFTTRSLEKEIISSVWVRDGCFNLFMARLQSRVTSEVYWWPFSENLQWNDWKLQGC